MLGNQVFLSGKQYFNKWTKINNFAAAKTYIWTCPYFIAGREASYFPTFHRATRWACWLNLSHFCMKEKTAKNPASPAVFTTELYPSQIPELLHLSLLERQLVQNSQTIRLS